MPNPYYYMSNQGAILRRMFPEQLSTQKRIIIYTIVFILNIVAVVLIQNEVIYKFTDVSRDGLAQEAYFEDCKIREVKNLQTSDVQLDLYSVTYENEEGIEETVYLEAFPFSAFERYRITASSEPSIALFQAGNQLKVLAGIYIACGVVLLAIEQLILTRVCNSVKQKKEYD